MDTLKPIFILTGLLMPQAAFAAHADIPPKLEERDVLSIRDGRFFLDGKPFAEISFNKFDLLWQLYGELTKGQSLDEANPMVRAQDSALRELHEMGFRSIRFFALPWGPAGPESYANVEKRKLLYEALDKTVELCERNNIRLVWSLGAGSFTDTKIVPGRGWMHGDEHLRELIANPESRSRKLLYAYIDETVSRYKHSKAVLMWEISNEVTLQADIGDRNGVREGQRMPTLKDVARFFDDVAQRIKAVDPLRLVNNGGSHMRESQWHLYQGQGWTKDTFEEQFRCFDLLYKDTAIDVIDVHSYMNNKPGYVIADGQGGEASMDFRGWMTIAKRIGKPLMIGELGLQPAARTNKDIWDETPDYFESYGDVDGAKPWLEKTLDGVIDAGVQLAYWWCYQSDRLIDQNNPQRFDLTRQRNPKLVACIVEANKRLQTKLAATTEPSAQRSATDDALLTPLVKKLPLPGEIFAVARRTAFLIPGKKDTVGGGKPWVWYAPTLPRLPGNEERWMFERFRDAGIAIAGIDVGESFGSPAGRALFTDFHREMTKKRGYSAKPVLLGRSRGGLMTLSWAVENPNKVAAFAGIYPVCNVASYPGVANAASAFGMTPEQLQTHLTDHNPVDRLASLAQAGVPLFATHGDSDKVVPLAANSGLMKTRYTALGGKMQLVVPPGQGHNMWQGFFQCQELVDFVLEQTKTP